MSSEQFSPTMEHLEQQASMFDRIVEKRARFDGKVEQKLIKIADGDLTNATAWDYSLRLGALRARIKTSMQEAQEKSLIINQQLVGYEQAKAYLLTLSERQLKLAQMKDLCEKKFIPEAVFVRFQQQYEEYEALPESSPTLKRGLEFIREQNRKAQEAEALASTQKPTGTAPQNRGVIPGTKADVILNVGPQVDSNFPGPRIQFNDEEGQPWHSVAFVAAVAQPRTAPPANTMLESRDATTGRNNLRPPYVFQPTGETIRGQAGRIISLIWEAQHNQKALRPQEIIELLNPGVDKATARSRYSANLSFVRRRLSEMGYELVLIARPTSESPTKGQHARLYIQKIDAQNATVVAASTETRASEASSTSTESTHKPLFGDLSQRDVVALASAFSIHYDALDQLISPYMKPLEKEVVTNLLTLENEDTQRGFNEDMDDDEKFEWTRERRINALRRAQKFLARDNCDDIIERIDDENVQLLIVYLAELSRIEIQHGQLDRIDGFEFLRRYLTQPKERAKGFTPLVARETPKPEETIEISSLSASQVHVVLVSEAVTDIVEEPASEQEGPATEVSTQELPLAPADDVSNEPTKKRRQSLATREGLKEDIREVIPAIFEEITSQTELHFPASPGAVTRAYNYITASYIDKLTNMGILKNAGKGQTDYTATDVATIIYYAQYSESKGIPSNLKSVIQKTIAEEYSKWVKAQEQKAAQAAAQGK